MSIAFKTEEFKPFKKEFRGVIVAAEYSEEPFGLKGAPEVEEKQRQRYGVIPKKLGIKIETDEYEKYQYEWYFPSARIGTKWHELIQALERTGAMFTSPPSLI